MADYYNYNNISLKVNGSGILANSASFSHSNELSKVTEINRIGGDGYLAAGGLNGTLSLTYYVDAINGDPLYMPDMKPGQNIFNLDFGGMAIQSGYLNSYAWSASPHGILQVSAGFQFYEDFGDGFSPEILPDQNWDWYKMSDLTVSLEGIDVSSRIVSMSYDETYNFTPLYNISGTAPVEHRYGEKIKSLNLDTYNILEAIPYTGKEVTVDVGIRGTSAQWSVKGMLQSKSIEINFGEKIISTLNLTDNGYGKAPSLVGSSTGGQINVDYMWALYGFNLENTTAIYFNNKIITKEFTCGKTDGSDSRFNSWINVKVPRFARSGPVKVITTYGEAAHDQDSTLSTIIPNINTLDIP